MNVHDPFATTTPRSAEGLFAKPEATIYFSRLYDDVILPSKRDEDAGYDIYGYWQDDNAMIAPHETVMLPTGLASAFPKGYVIILKERGSTGTIGIGQRSGVIDSGFRGEWFIPVTNHNDKPILFTKETDPRALDELREEYIVYPYTKAICQAILFKLPTTEIQEIRYDKLIDMRSTRGAGSIGSSGK